MDSESIVRTIALVRPSFSGVAGDALQPLAFAALAAHTPSGFRLTLFDETVEDLPDFFAADLVALSVETYSARRAYEIAARCRSRGQKVVMGGYHPTLNPDEALTHADAVLVGEAEGGAWERLLADFARGTLGGLYRSERTVTSSDIKYERSIFKGKNYAPIVPIQFSRGCRFACGFCSVRAFFGARNFCRDVQAMVEEVKSLSSRNLFFVDDNLFLDKDKFDELMRALIPLRRRWGCQVSLDVADDESRLRLMHEAGCRVVFMGFESLSRRSLADLNKSGNLARLDYSAILARFRRQRIHVFGSFVFGSQDDRAEDLSDALAFAKQEKMFLACFLPLIPMPGTPFSVRSEARLEGTDPWWLSSMFRFGDAVLPTSSLSRQKVSSLCHQANADFCSWKSVVQRSLTSANLSLENAVIHFFGNVVNRQELKRKYGKERHYALQESQSCSGCDGSSFLLEGASAHPRSEPS